MNGVTTTPTGDILALPGIGRVAPEKAQKKSSPDDLMSGDFTLALMAAVSQAGAVAQSGPDTQNMGAIMTPEEGADCEGSKSGLVTALLPNVEAQNAAMFATGNESIGNFAENNVTKGMDPAAILLSKPNPAVADVRSGKITIDSQWNIDPSIVAPTPERFVGIDIPSTTRPFIIDKSQRNSSSPLALMSDHTIRNDDAITAKDARFPLWNGVPFSNEPFAPVAERLFNDVDRMMRPFAEFSRVDVIDVSPSTASKSENARQSMMASNDAGTAIISAEHFDRSLWQNIAPRVGTWSPVIQARLRSEESPAIRDEQFDNLSNEVAPDGNDVTNASTTAKQAPELNRLLQRDPESKLSIVDLQPDSSAATQETRTDVASVVLSGSGAELPVEAPVSAPRLVIPESAYADLKPGVNTIKVALEPESLGHAELTLRVIDDRVIGALYVESNEAKRMVESSLHNLVERLRQEGLTLERLDVALSGERGESPRRQELTTRRQGRNATPAFDEETDAVESASASTVLTTPRTNEIGPRRVNALA